MSSTQQAGGGQGTVWNVPNILSMLRLIGVPVFLWALLTHQDVLALLVLMGSGISDYLDGKIARHYGLVTKLGQYLDPIADRLYIATTLFGLAWREIIPWWLVLVLLARDAFVLALYPTVRAYRTPVPPVHFIGKAATFNLLYAFPLLLLGQFDGWLGAVALPVGWAFAWWGTVLYWLGAVLYAWQVSSMVSQRRQQWQEVGV